MVQRRQRERSLFEVFLPDGHKLWPDWLRRIDTLLEDEAVIDTVTIRKGKIAKPNEFGNLVTIQEAEHQIVTAFEIHAGRPADVTLWTPALDRHQAIFGRAPDLAVGDRGFSSARNEQAAVDRGVRRVILPRPGA